MVCLAFVPPQLQSIGNEVGGLTRMTKNQKRLINRLRASRLFENSQRNENGGGPQVMITRFDRNSSS